MGYDGEGASGVGYSRVVNPSVLEEYWLCLRLKKRQNDWADSLSVDVHTYCVHDGLHDMSPGLVERDDAFRRTCLSAAHCPLPRVPHIHLRGASNSLPIALATLAIAANGAPNTKALAFCTVCCNTCEVRARKQQPILRRQRRNTAPKVWLLTLFLSHNLAATACTRQALACPFNSSEVTRSCM